MKRFLLLLIGVMLIVVGGVAQSQSCKLQVSGTVYEKETGETLPFAQVYCPSLERGVLADSLGHYVFQDVCPGQYVFFCRHIGCVPLQDTLIIQSSLVHDFRHEHLPLQTAEVFVLEERWLPSTAASKDQLTRADLQLTQGLSLAESAKELTGVTVLRTGQSIGKPVLHGLHSNRLLILNNGVRQEGQQWGNEHAPEIDPFVADHISLIKGAGALQFGPDALAGVILVQPSILPLSPSITGKLRLAGFSNGRQGSSSLLLQGRLKRWSAWSWRVQGTLRQGGNMRTPDYFLANTGLKEHNFSWTLGYNRRGWNTSIYYSRFASEIGIFSGAHIGNLTDLYRAIQSEEPAIRADFTYAIGGPKQVLLHELVKWAVRKQVNERWEVQWNYSRQFNRREEFDKDKPLNDSLAALNLPALQFEITSHNGDALLAFHPNDRTSVKWGVQALYQFNTYEGRFFIPNFRKYTAGSFVIYHGQSTDKKHEWEGGLRYDFISQQSFFFKGDSLVKPLRQFQGWSANAGYRYHTDGGMQWAINVAETWRLPAVNELYSRGLHHGVAAIETGNEGLETERSFGLFGEWALERDGMKLVIQPWSQWIRHFIYLKPASEPVLTIMGAFPAFNYEQKNAILSGLDAQIEMPLVTNWTAQAKASVLRARKWNSQEFIVQMPSDQYRFQLKYEREKWLGLRRVFLNAGVQYVNKQWRVPATEDFVGSPKGYALVQAQVGLAIPIKMQELEIAIGCDNLTNEQYRDYLNRFRYYANDIGRNVSLRLTLPFAITQYQKQDHHEE